MVVCPCLSVCMSVCLPLYVGLSTCLCLSPCSLSLLNDAGSLFIHLAFRRETMPSPLWCSFTGFYLDLLLEIIEPPFVMGITDIAQIMTAYGTALCYIYTRRAKHPTWTFIKINRYNVCRQRRAPAYSLFILIKKRIPECMYTYVCCTHYLFFQDATYVDLCCRGDMPRPRRYCMYILFLCLVGLHVYATIEPS